MIARFSDTLAPVALLAALLVWGMTLLGLGGPSAYSEIVTIGLATLLVLSAQVVKPPISNVLLWLSGGLWAGEAYVNTQTIGLASTLIAVLTIAAAALQERRRGAFSVSGPAAFIVAMVIAIAVSLFVTK